MSPNSGSAATRPPSAALPSGRPVALLTLGCLVFALWVGTQATAYRLGYHRRLGPAVGAIGAGDASWWRLGAGMLAATAVLVGLGSAARRRPAEGNDETRFVVGCLLGATVALLVSLGPVYGPERVLVWAFRYERAARVAPVVRDVTQQGVWIAGATWVATIALIAAARPRVRTTTPSRAHGSARWGTGAELANSAGLILGRHLDATPDASSAANAAGTLLRYAGDGHLITVAPTRSGKGVGCVVPNLLTYPGPVLVTDPKGENAAVTARARRALGQAVHVLDPFGVVGPATAAYNPMDLVDAASPDAVDDARLIADMLVVCAPGKGGGEHAFWDEEARALLAGLVLYAAAHAPPEIRTLAHVRELLTLPPEPFQVVLRDMLESNACCGLVSRAAARLVQKADRERSGVVSAAQSHTHFLDSPRMARVLGASTFALGDVAVGGRASVYLVLPPDRMEAYHRWLRLMVASALTAVTRAGQQGAGTAGPGGTGQRVLFLLDEFAQLGRMAPVERAVGLAAGYGATFWLMLQDLAQLKATYGDRAQTFLANAAVLQAFGTADWETAEYLSKMTGEATVRVASENQSAGVSRGERAQRQQGAAVTVSETRRRLLTPDEVLRLARDEALLFSPGRHPVRARRLNYLADSALLARADANPLHRPAA